MDESEEPGLGFAAPPKAGGANARPEPYRVLARKYRPQNFTGLIGQEALVKTLTNAFAAGRIAHAFMLTGVRGVGKTTTARIIARALNCVGPDGKRKEPTIDPCGVCEPCRAIAESRFVDVQEMDAASRTSIDDIREIIEGTRYAPAAARYKVYIVDEVHMLSKNAFNGLLKTLEEPPPHVKFIFATTEIRKVPVTVLSRCQRFDLRRIETEVLAAHFADIAKKEKIAVEPAALSLIARAAEGSVRDGLSLLDQAIAHHAGETGAIAADSVRDMLGLADRGRVLDLFEKLMAGEIAAALSGLRELYDKGADPLVVMQDLLETTHFLTRVKVAPLAEGFFDGGSAEATRAAAMAGKLSVAALARAWQILLKGLVEVREAANALPAAEMALVRLAYAAELPPTERLLREAREASAAPVSPGSQTPMPPRPGGAPRAQTAARQEDAPRPMASAPAVSAPTSEIRTLDDVVALAKKKGARVLERLLENDVHLVAIERGRIEFRPGPQAPKTLASDLAQRMRDWTGERWIVTLASEGGAPTIAGARAASERAKKDAVSQEPFVRAVLDAFPGAEIVAVREKESDVPPPVSDEESPKVAGLTAGSEIERLIQLLAKLPGLGPRSARRAALVLLKKRETLLEPLADAMAKAAEALKQCSQCGNLDTTDPCVLCRDPARETGIICVVEDVADLWALERASVFRGRYHVLGGALSALDGVTPERLNLPKLLARVKAGGVSEVILAMNATVEGQTTAHYLMDALEPLGVKATRLAHGVPVGGELDYLDEGTLSAAFKARRPV